MPNKSGARGIHTAASKGHVAVVNSLILKGESVDAATNVSNKQMKQKLCDLLMQVSFLPIWILDEANKNKTLYEPLENYQKLHCVG